MQPPSDKSESAEALERRRDHRRAHNALVVSLIGRYWEEKEQSSVAGVAARIAGGGSATLTKDGSDLMAVMKREGGGGGAGSRPHSKISFG